MYITCLALVFFSLLPTLTNADHRRDVSFRTRKGRAGRTLVSRGCSVFENGATTTDFSKLTQLVAREDFITYFQSSWNWKSYYQCWLIQRRKLTQAVMLLACILNMHVRISAATSAILNCYVIFLSTTRQLRGYYHVYISTVFLTNPFQFINQKHH
jgi:hypothetical protein